MEEGARRVRRGKAAPDESLGDERRQVEIREGGGDFYRRRIDPASHPRDYNGCRFSNFPSFRLLTLTHCQSVYSVYVQDW